MPEDPVMLFSFVNMKLRDNEYSLEELCSEYNIDMSTIEKKLSDIGYQYDEILKQFK